MNIFKLSPKAVPETLILLSEKYCKANNANWLLRRVIQPAFLSVTELAFGGILEKPNKGKLRKAEVIEELKGVHSYCEAMGVTTIAVAHPELFKYLTDGEKFTWSIGRSVQGVNIKVTKDDDLDFTAYNIVPFLNPIVLNQYPAKGDEVARGLKVIKALQDGTYQDTVELGMETSVIVKTKQQAANILSKLFYEKRLTCDIEATGLAWYAEDLLTISFGPQEEEAYCFPLHDQYEGEVVDVKGIKELVLRFMKHYKGELIGHNFVGFDMAFIAHAQRGGDFQEPIEDKFGKCKFVDTMLQTYILRNSTERVGLSLKELVYARMGAYDKDVDQSDLINATLTEVATYNNLDCKATWIVYNENMAELTKEGGKFDNVVEEFADIGVQLCKMQMHGLRVDKERLPEFVIELRDILEDLETRMHQHPIVQEAVDITARMAMRKKNKTLKAKRHTDWVSFKEPFNPSSPAQKATLFFDILNLPVIKKSKKTKKPSADADSIKEWLSDPDITDEAKEVVTLISEFTSGKKAFSTYVTVMEEKAVEVAPNDWRVFTNLNQTATITGRLSASGDINLQTIPNSSAYGAAIKRMFLPPEGFIMGMSDYAALEDRLIANESRDPNKLNVFLLGIDGHSLNAYGYFKEEFAARGLEFDISDPDSINQVKKVADDLRNDSKKYTFGFTYGAGPQKYGEALFNAYWETYSGIKKYNKTVTDMAQRTGYYISRFSGLRLWTPAINSSDEFIQSKEFRVVGNFSIQSGNFLMLRAIAKMQKWIEAEDLTKDVKLVLTVHDSVYLYIREDAKLIDRVNKVLIGFMGEDYTSNQPIHLDSELDLGYNMKDLTTISNDVTIADIETTMKTLKADEKERIRIYLEELAKNKQ